MTTDAFEHITGPRKSLVEFIQQSPLYGDDEIDLEREDSLATPGEACCLQPLASHLMALLARANAETTR